MTKNLGELFQAIWAELGWSLAEVARRLGYKNLSKAANKVQRLEWEGLDDDAFLVRLAAVLDIREGTVRDQIRADWLAYQRRGRSGSASRCR